MFHYIVYKADTVEEIYQCAYSLIKYLDLYNLKPPALHKLVIFTSQPAMLESYGSFFPNFDFREVSQATGDPKTWLKQPGDQSRRSLLHVSTNGYMVHPLESLFEKLENAHKYVTNPAPWITQYEDLKEFNVLLRSFFKKYAEESVPNQVKALHHINAVDIQEDKAKFQELGFTTRLLRSISGKGWKIANYTKKL